jgi:hypothetical protein
MSDGSGCRLSYLVLSADLGEESRSKLTNGRSRGGRGHVRCG